MFSYRAQRRNLTAAVIAGAMLTAGGGAMGQDVAGRLITIAPGRLVIRSEIGVPYTVQMDRSASFIVTGKARPTFLSEGQFIRFVAPVNTRETRVTEPVDELTIITPRSPPQATDWPVQWPGVFFPGPEGEPLAVAPGFGPQDEDQDDADPDAESSDVITFDVRGRIKKLKHNSVTVVAPNRYFGNELRLELADSPEIDVALADLGPVRPGDFVRASGQKVGPSLVRASRVSIELQQPLGELTVAEKRAKAGLDQQDNRRRPTADQARREGGTFEVADADQPAPSVQRQPHSRPGSDDDRATPLVGDKPRAATTNAAQPETELSPADREEAIGRLVRLDPPPPEEELVRARLGDAPPVVLVRTQPVTIYRIRHEFGLPDRVFDAIGRFPTERGHNVQPIQWELWQYGGLRLLVDETGMVRYVAGGVDGS